MKKNKLKIGIIGAGYWSNNILSTLEKIENNNIYVFDINYTNLYQSKKNFPSINIIKKEKLFFKISFDAIMIITPPDKHYYYAKKSLMKGFNVFLEKPGTLQKEKLKDLYNLSLKLKKVFMIGYLYNHNIYIKYIKKIIDKNILGKIKYIIFERLNLGPVRNNYSCFYDLSSHDISTLLYFFKKEPSIDKIYSQDFLKKKIYDLGNIYLKVHKIKVEIRSSWLSPEKIRKIIIVGTKKMLLFDEMNKKNTIKIYHKYAEYPAISKFKKGFFSAKANIFMGKTFIPKILFEPALLSEIKFFLKKISNKKNTIFFSNGLHAYKVLKILENVHKNIKSNL